jgi:hypothetical protein
MKLPLIRGVCALRAKNQIPASLSVGIRIKRSPYGTGANLAPKPRDKLASTHPSIRLSLGWLLPSSASLLFTGQAILYADSDS